LQRSRLLGFVRSVRFWVWHEVRWQGFRSQDCRFVYGEIKAFRVFVLQVLWPRSNSAASNSAASILTRRFFAGSMFSWKRVCLLDLLVYRTFTFQRLGCRIVQGFLCEFKNARRGVLFTLGYGRMTQAAEGNEEA
jgi:hypothetical protein